MDTPPPYASEATIAPDTASAAEGTAPPDWGATYAPPAAAGAGRAATRMPTPIVLQRIARPTVRRHVLRHAVRLAVLLAADVTTLVTQRLLIRGVRDEAWLGESIGAILGRLVSPGSYPPLQLLVAVVLGLAVFGTYGQGDRRRDAGRLLAGTALGYSLLFWGRMWASFDAAALLGFVLASAAGGAALVLSRSAVDVVARRARRRDRPRALVIGGLAGAGGRGPLRIDRAELDVVGVVDAGVDGDPHALGHVDGIAHLIHEHRIDTLVIGGGVAEHLVAPVVDAGTASGCEVYTAPRIMPRGILRPKLVWRGGFPLIQLTYPTFKGQQLLLKRCLDVALASAVLLVLAPFFALVAIAITLDSRGPVFFRQERIGYGGKRFRMMKFRTMCEGADGRKASVAHLNHTADPRLFKIPNDPRVTRVGATLRRWSIDELPQLLNVLAGHMTLVGPRPFFEADLVRYEERHFRRLGAKPGITGLWQVSGRSGVTDFEEVVRLDQEYIDRWTPWLDLKILVRTVPAVLRRTGAY